MYSVAVDNEALIREIGALQNLVRLSTSVLGSKGWAISAIDPVPVNVSVESERFLARLKLFGAEDFADEEV